jgi:hypothetical protein
MNWEAVSAVAELIGVLVVVISLIYVALQVRQNTQTVRAGTELETGRLWSELHSRMAHSPDMADIWDKGHTNADELTTTEKRKFIWFVAEYFFLVESLFRQREAEYLSKESWTQHRATAAGMLLNPLISSWWESGVSPYSAEFKTNLDNARAELGDAVWSYSPLSDL